jgi:hypothetical protein
MEGEITLFILASRQAAVKEPEAADGSAQWNLDCILESARGLEVTSK